MIRSAAGQPLAFAQDDLKIDGWAIESRIYAEDPYRKFLPSIGRLVRYAPPREGEHDGYVVRNDAGVREGDAISMYYDPMISKLCAWGASRADAVEGMARALEDFHIEGLGQNIPFLSAVMDQDRFRSGRISTSYIADEFPGGFKGLDPSPLQTDILTAVGAHMQRALARRAGSPDRADWIVFIGDEQRPVRLRGETPLSIEITGEDRALTLDAVDWRPGLPLFRARLNGKVFTATVTPAAEGFVIRHRAAKARVLVLTPRSAELHGKLPPRLPADTSKRIVSPMPGLVVSLDVTVGAKVSEGQVVAVIEAMKMQNIIRAERDGVVATVGAAAGDSVAADQVLVEFAA
jgi:propionyl-CoA carboxylase alpha chain